MHDGTTWPSTKAQYCGCDGSHGSMAKIVMSMVTSNDDGDYQDVKHCIGAWEVLNVTYRKECIANLSMVAPALPDASAKKVIPLYHGYVSWTLS